MKQWLNPDGKTYNGAQMLADLTGLTMAEITWTAARLKQLMTIQGMGKEEAKYIVSEESKLKPWSK